MFIIYLMACTESTLTSFGHGVLEVYPNKFDFGPHAYDEGEITKTFIVKNVGDSAVTDAQSSLILQNDFLIRDFPEEIGRGEEIEFEIAFDPSYDGSIYNSVITAYNEASDVTVNLSGTGLAPKILLLPGTTTVAGTALCKETTAFRIYNVGSMDLELYDVDMLVSYPSTLSIDSSFLPTQFPHTIPPSGFIPLFISTENEDFYPDFFKIDVESDDPQSPVESAEVEFYVNPSEMVSETFHQKLAYKSDILFVVDNSGSMDNEQTSLINNLENFINEFVENNIDFNIGVITTDSPVLRGPILNSSTPDLINSFKSQVSVGITGSSFETGLHQAYLSTKSSSNTNYGQALQLIRQDANFSVILITDENDSSPLTDADYVYHFNSLGSSNSLIHTIISPPPSGCAGLSVNQRLANLSYLTGGTIMSICSIDWGYDLEQVAKQSYLAASFYLAETPINGSVSVLVNGVPASGWSYNNVFNSVTFEPDAVPEDGEEIVIQYMLTEECP